MADAEQARDRPNEIIVAVAADGRYAVNRKPVDGRSVELLAAELTAAAAGSSETMLIISADATAAHQSVINVMDAARRAGLAQLTFATQSSSGGAKRAEPWLGPAPEDPRRRVERRCSGSGRDRGAAAHCPAAAVLGLPRRRRRCAGGCSRSGCARAAERLPVPVIVVGNLVVGGAGKTPTVIALVAPAARARPHARHRLARLRPRRVDACARSAPTAQRAGVGDEPLLLRQAHRRAGVRRHATASPPATRCCRPIPTSTSSSATTACSTWRSARDVEVLVFDDRGTGNGRLLPAGPLREPLPRQLPANQLVLYNAGAADDAAARLPRRGARWPASPRSPTGGAARRRAAAALEALRGTTRASPPPAWRGRQRFFAMLRDARPRRSIELPLPDHHDFRALPWPATTGDVVVTEKDAVKLDPAQRIGSRVWVATLDFEPEPGVRRRRCCAAAAARRAAR